MRKKYIVYFVVFLLLVLGLAACTNASDANKETDKTENTEGVAIDYPTKPIEIIVPYDAGGGQDIAARTFAKYLEETIGQRVIVSNVTGGGGVVGHTQLANAKPDGYTIGIIHTFTAVDQFTLKGIPYTEKDFLPVSMIAADPHVVVVNEKLGIDNLNDFVEYVRGRPGEVTIGLGGSWNGHDFFRINLEKAIGAEFERMPFQGGAPALTALAGGNVDSATPFVAEAMAQIDVGTLVPLAVTSDERSPLLPDVPTVKESGYDVTQYMWRGFAVPTDTPAEIVQFLSQAFEETFNNPEFQEDARKAGIEPSFKNHEEFKQYYDEEFASYRDLIKEIGLEPQ